MAYNNGQQGKGRGRNPGDLSVPDLKELENKKDAPYASGGQYDPRFIVEFARKISDMLTGRGYFVTKDENKSSQIRKFFDFARRVEISLKSGQLDYPAALLELNSLRYQTSYACERGKISRCFVDFIDVNIDKIHNKEDLYFFIKHFEAVVGYSKERK